MYIPKERTSFERKTSRHQSISGQRLHKKLTHIFPSQMKITQFSVLMMKTTHIEAGFLNLRVIDIWSLVHFSLPLVLGIESRTYTCWSNTLH